jgi:hypothetical protein
MMIPGLELRFISSAVGHGVCTTRPIPRGTIVWVLDPFDRRISETEYASLPFLLRAEVDSYGYLESNGDRILCWDLGRYMNHSCAPTGRNVGGLFKVATRDIPAGGELTTDYAVLNIALPSACRCGFDQCRGSASLTGNDLAAYRCAWEREAAAAVAIAADVEQPLASLLELHPTLADLHDALQRGRHYPPAPLGSVRP